jgi:hypothetical protein
MPSRIGELVVLGDRDTVFGDTWRRPATSEVRRYVGLLVRLIARHPFTVVVPVEDFLFNRRRGHCEYFASSMAVMLRSVGIPARLVNGFRTGEFNDVTSQYVVRASNAHSWVEAWITGSGWMTFDPTPSDPSEAGIGLGTRLALLFDTAEQFWQDWVLGYDLDRQIVLASRMEESGRKLRFRWLEGLGTKIKSALNSGASYAPMLAAADGRCVGLHFGTYDYTAALGIAAGYQSLAHPAADHAKAVMQAAAAGTGAVEVRAMKKAGYRPETAAAISAAAATIGPIIPPSLPMVIYGVSADVSIGRLFLAGVIPGVLMGLSLMTLVAIIAPRQGLPRLLTPAEAKQQFAERFSHQGSPKFVVRNAF